MSPSLVRLLVAWNLLILGVCAVAAPASPQKVSKPSTDVQRPSGGKHCLWRVTDAKAPVYLLGSIHALRRSDYPLPPVIENAIRGSREFYFEYDHNRGNEMMRKLEAAARYPHGISIKDKVRRETWAHLRKINRGDNFDWMNHRPWAIAFFYLEHPGFAGVRHAYGLDTYVDQKARAMHCPMHALETNDEHVQVLAGMTDQESEVYLLQSLVFGSQANARFQEDVIAWKAGDTTRISDLDLPDPVDVPLNPRMLYNRNARWIPVIEDAMRTGHPTLVCAGIMHFSGPASVLKMLRSRGHNIEQL